MSLSSPRTIIMALLLTIFSPSLLYAQAVAQVTGGITSLGGVVDTFTSTVVKAVGSLFIALAVTAFFWGVVQYIYYKRNGNAGGTKVGGEFMAWGLVALFVMFSVYGIIRYSQKILNVEGTEITIPRFNISGSGGSMPSAPNNQQQNSPGVMPGAPGGSTQNPFGGVGTQIISGCPMGYVRDSTVTEGNTPGCRPATEGTGNTVCRMDANGECPSGCQGDDESPTGCSVSQ